MKSVRCLAVLGAGAATAAALLVPQGVASAAPPVPDVLDAKLVAEVQPLGYFVTAVAIHYDRAIHLHDYEIPAAAFEVAADLGAGEQPRTVTRAYLADEPERLAEGERSGDWVVLELDTADPNSSATYYDGLTHLLPLVEGYSVEQVSDVTAERGRVRIPASGEVVQADGIVSPVVDDFARAAHTGESGVTLQYGLYSPEHARRHPGSKREFPLVVALHGAGERGTDNLVQIAGNELSVSFARPDQQEEHPAFVLSPQGPPPSIVPLEPGTSVWEDEGVQATLMELIEKTMDEQPVDPDRVYVTGLSMGSMGTWDILPKHPDLFAAALPVTGYADLESAPLVADIPIWATHSIDDGTVLFDRPDSDWHMMDAIEATGTPVVRDEWAGSLPDAENEARALAQWQAAEAAGSHTLFTAFSVGTTPVNAHFSWVPTYGNGVMLDWLFAQRLSDRS